MAQDLAARTVDNGRHNEANGRANTDGMDEKHSWNCGVEGDAGVTPAVLRVRKQQAKNFRAVLMLAKARPCSDCLRGHSERDIDLYAMINAVPDDLAFSVQEHAPAGWTRVVDASLDSPGDFTEPGAERPVHE